MFLTWDKNLPWHEYQFVIVGSGPAGLYLADALSARGKVLVIEAGGTSDPQSLGEGYYEVISTGRNYNSLGSRLSSFGGTSNHWGGHSHPLSQELFRNRPGSAGWPISFEDYAAHLDDAARFLNLHPFGTPTDKTSIEAGILGGYENVEVARFQFSNPTRRLGDPVSVEIYGLRTDIDVLVDTRLTDIELSSDGDRVAVIDLLHRPSRQTAHVPVGRLFLATGGIENARILLWAARKYRAGNPLSGGPNELTGTHFSDHLFGAPVEIFLDARADMADAPAQGPHQTHLAWELSEAFRTEHRLPRFGAFPESGSILAVEDTDLDDHLRYYLGQSGAYIKLDPAFQFEHTPAKSSRVTLDSRLDADGIAMPSLHWDVPTSDFEAMRKAVLMFCGLLNQKGFAKARLKRQFLQTDWSTADFGAADHPMGTTRMGDSALDGVVDRNCQVFGLRNLFVAGSSVFPSGDYVNPTLNLVALAGRLGNYVSANSWVRLRFGTGRTDNDVLRAGWSYLEGSGVWSDGPDASLEIARSDLTQFVLAGRGYRAAKGSVSVNGKAIFSGFINDAIGRSFTCTPAETMVIAFHFDNPAAPKDFGENDETRKLGIFLSGMEVR